MVIITIFFFFGSTQQIFEVSSGFFCGFSSPDGVNEEHPEGPEPERCGND